MGRRQVTDEGHGLKIWRIVANMATKQSQIAENGWVSRLELHVGLTAPHSKKISILREVTKGLGRIIWLNDLVKENVHDI
jgi:hypothetical protein